MKENKIDLSGQELISLAGSIAICFGNKCNMHDLHKIRMLFQTIASNIAIIECEGIIK